VIAVALPLVRLPLLYFVWKVPTSWPLEIADTAIDLVVLLVLVQVIRYVARQRQEIQVLQGLLPICTFCKRIRDESGDFLARDSGQPGCSHSGSGSRSRDRARGGPAIRSEWPS
jgi:hypothetical protein